MSTALVSFYDFNDHCSYRSNTSASTALQNSKNSFVTPLDRKASLASVYNSVQQNSNNNNNNLTNNNNNINNLNNNNNVNAITRRVVTNTASVPILSHSSHRLQSSNITVPVMHPKSPIGVSNNANTQSSVALIRGLSTGSQTCSLTNNNNNNNNTINGNNNNKEHKKLDRSFSEPAEKSAQLVRLNSTTTVGPMSSRYKTELCRSFGEVGNCKYGDKCQFAHGGHELRVITRHPKFKTENCKSFHSTGFCPYGPRCHFIHNSEESKKSMLSNLSGAGNNNNNNNNNNNCNNGCNGITNNGSQNRELMMNNANINMNMSMNGNNSITNNGFVQSYHSNNNSHALRPKALSIGSYSLGSSGEISPPSSQSGSPTSLNSFFTEDPFNFNSPSNQVMNSCANNAFSFSPDFASLVSQHKNSGLSSFSGSQPILCPPFPLQTNMSGDMNDNQQTSAIYSNQMNSNDHHMIRSTHEATQGMATTPPPPVQPSKVTPVSYPMAPESPVDSIASDVEALKLEQSSLSPIPTCSSPLDVSKSLPRLPIFTRFSNNGNNTNNDLE